MESLAPMCLVDTIDTWLSIVSKFLLRLANFIRLSTCLNSPGIIRIVSIGERKIFLLMKWERILNLIEVSPFIHVLSPIVSGVCTVPLNATSIGILLLKTHV
jgi:hypothetical protein